MSYFQPFTGEWCFSHLCPVLFAYQHKSCQFLVGFAVCLLMLSLKCLSKILLHSELYKVLLNSQFPHLIQQRLWYWVPMECCSWWIIQSFLFAIWISPHFFVPWGNILTLGWLTWVLCISLFASVSHKLLSNSFSSSWHRLLSVIPYVTADCITVSQPPVWQVLWRIAAGGACSPFEFFTAAKSCHAGLLTEVVD